MCASTLADWLGIYLDTTDGDAVHWDEIGAIVEEAYRMVAPKRLITELNGRLNN